MNWLGALLTVASSYICGVMLANGEKEKLTAIDSLIRLFDCMRRRISAERLPLYRIFAEFRDTFLERIGFLEVLRSSRHGLERLWENAVATLSTDSETADELLHFGESLGALPLDEQIKRIDAAHAFLNEKRAKISGTLQQKRKSIKSVCLLTGIAIAIILL